MRRIQERLGPWVLLIALVVAFAMVGVILLTQVHYASWQYVGPGEMDAVHRHWATAAVQAIIHPLSVFSGICMVGTVLLRHPRVSWWLAGAAAGVQVTTFATTMLMWSRWQHEIGRTGRVRLPDGWW
ncbi:hypothetical protein [Spongiactinospora sp. 9N601]|uniref:hypothetical protein n=1 Tax=Spongiactinospora sp. 9N601 TaxID=3375149 RepID=UPI0037989CBE